MKEVVTLITRRIVGIQKSTQSKSLLHKIQNETDEN